MGKYSQKFRKSEAIFERIKQDPKKVNKISAQKLLKITYIGVIMEKEIGCVFVKLTNGVPPAALGGRCACPAEFSRM